MLLNLKELKQGMQFKSKKDKQSYKVLYHGPLIIGDKKKVILTVKNISTNEIASKIY